MRYLFFVFVICLSQIGRGQQDGWLYRVEGPNINKSYLLGVLPSQSSLTFQWSDSVYAAIANTEVVAVDAVVDSLAQESFREKAALPAGERFDRWLNNTKFAAINEKMQAFQQGSLWNYVSYYPLYVTHLLQQWSLAEQQSGQDFLMKLVAAQQKKIVGLYTGEALPAIMKTMPLSLQSDLLLSFTTVWFDAVFQERMVRHYLSGQKDLLYQFMGRHLPIEYQAFYQQGQIDGLAHEIPAQARRQSTTFFVDATLLGGEKGLVATLRAEGITLTPIGNGLELVSTTEPTPTIPTDTVQFESDPGVAYYTLNEEFRAQYFAEIIPTWHQVTSYRGAFSVLMPDRPEEIVEQLPVEGGNVSMRLYKFEDRALNLFYLVSFYDYPSWYTLEDQPGFFRQVISKTVSRFGGILLLERDISNDQFRGKEIEIQVEGDFTIRVRFYLVGNRMYQVALGATGKKAYAKQNEAFLRSFRILDQRMAGWTPVNISFASLEMPGIPNRESGIVYVDSMPAQYFTYWKKDANTQLQYATTVTYLPPEGKWKKIEPIFQKMIYEAAKQLSAVLIREEPIEQGAFTGTYVALGGANGRVLRMSILYHDNRIVQHMVLGPEDSAFSAFADHFFSAFTVSDYEY